MKTYLVERWVKHTQPPHSSPPISIVVVVSMAIEGRNPKTEHGGGGGGWKKDGGLSSHHYPCTPSWDTGFAGVSSALPVPVPQRLPTAIPARVAVPLQSLHRCDENGKRSDDEGDRLTSIESNRNEVTRRGQSPSLHGKYRNDGHGEESPCRVCTCHFQLEGTKNSAPCTPPLRRRCLYWWFRRGVRGGCR
jgi:hypothetical protein